MNSLEDVEFLARSANRVRALRLLSDDAYDRRELMDELGVSKATVNRILDDFTDHGWVVCGVEHSRKYRATPSGSLTSTGLDSLLDTVEQARGLGVVLSYLPAEDLPFDATRLADATITVPSEGDPIAPVHRVVERMRSAEWVCLLPVGYAAESLRVSRNAVVERGQSFEAVFKTEILDCIAADSTAVRYLSELLEAGCDLYHYRGPVPYGVYESDAGYGVSLVDERGAAQALVETDDEVVGAWVRSRLETARDAAERLDLSSWAKWCGQRVST